jgi:hypothetical protein
MVQERFQLFNTQATESLGQQFRVKQIFLVLTSHFQAVFSKRRRLHSRFGAIYFQFLMESVT